MQGFTPLHWAARNGHDACVELLLDAGAYKEAADKDVSYSLAWLLLCGACPCVPCAHSHTGQDTPA